uniref:Aminotransferase class I and II n=1 Tax=Caulobacter sp. (strain K31) TaxID=366602 RepID=B0SZZ7_CAUSK
MIAPDPCAGSAEPTYPAWLHRHLDEQAAIIRALDPFPFAQPADTTGFHSLHQNDYLRLSNHPEVIRARTEAASRSRVDSFSSFVFGGAAAEHETFAALLREALQACQVIATTAGWTANVGLIEAIAAPDVPIYVDAEAHASLLDGVRLSLGRRLLFRHNDPQHLEDRIAIHGPGIVIIDALYSTDGTLADLPRFVAICERHECTLILDEAHSFGMFGEAGGGLAVACGLAHRVHFRTLSLSKALGGHGGAIACGAQIAPALWSRLRPVIFSSATSSILAAAHAKALELTMTDRRRAEHCQAMATLLRDRLNASGIDTLGSASQIISIKLQGGDAAKLYGALRERGVLTSVFIYPAVQMGISLVRLSVHAEVTEADVDYVSATIVESLEALGLGMDGRVAA